MSHIILFRSAAMKKIQLIDNDYYLVKYQRNDYFLENYPSEGNYYLTYFLWCQSIKERIYMSTKRNKIIMVYIFIILNICFPSKRFYRFVRMNDKKKRIVYRLKIIFFSSILKWICTIGNWSEFNRFMIESVNLFAIYLSMENQQKMYRNHNNNNHLSINHKIKLSCFSLFTISLKCSSLFSCHTLVTILWNVNKTERQKHFFNFIFPLRNTIQISWKWHILLFSKTFNDREFIFVSFSKVIHFI